MLDIMNVLFVQTNSFCKALSSFLLYSVYSAISGLNFRTSFALNHCVTIFIRSDHQFFPPTGMASFWNNIGKSVETIDDLQGVKEDRENLIVEKYTQTDASMRVCCNKVSLLEHHTMKSVKAT